MSTHLFRAAILLAILLWLLTHLALAAVAVLITVRLGTDLLGGATPWTIARCGGAAVDVAHAFVLLLPHGLLRPRRGRTVVLALAAAAALVQNLAGAPPAPGTDSLRPTLALWPLLVAALLFVLERTWRALAEPAGADDAPAGFKGESYRQVQP